ncbi:MAG: hypothetical protein KGJ23_07790 [Euryarchaeota archaeon]|nr:hypothetical protein [Euryarchaeota archaeon]MDE1836501.1 hypothetical protein [Euryarchaeota archaeon]MDE1879304.1 hypothetical protein [Euryarchaeota archaeon]MDE2044471.1 hypothetical protein [Thermoplasmata archaeon]
MGAMVKVKLPSDMTRRELLDMLRFVGLIETIEGDTITYEANEEVPTRDVKRWDSFGARAEILEE